MIDDQIRTLPRKLPSVDDAAADIRRLTTALQARRRAAPDNAVELAALDVDLQRAAAVWRQLVPTGLGLSDRRQLSHPQRRGQRTRTIGSR